MKSPHELDIDGFKPFISSRIRSDSLRMTGRLDKVDTSVYTVIDQFEPVDSVLLLEVCVKSSIDVVDNGLPAVLSA
jgi:hypothetical protein